MAVRLRVAELMEAKNLKATQLQAQLTMLTREPVYPATLRRYINSSTDGKPGGPPLEKALPDAVAGIRGKRFKGTKKTSTGKANGKTYHNLYVNSALPSVDPASIPEPTTPAPAAAAAPISPGEMPF